MDVTKICLNCFNEKEGGVQCSYCNYNDGDNADNEMHLAPSTILKGQYIIGKVLGFGGFGVTYLAYDLNFQITRAIKEYLPGEISARNSNGLTIYSYSGEAAVDYEYGLEQFIEEGRKLAMFSHIESIVSVFDYFEENNTAYLVMEFLEGIDLNKYLKEKGGKLSEKETLRIIDPILTALDKVHSIGIIHRDVSPDNIFVLNSTKVKLIDFGAARQAMGEKSETVHIFLKRGYAPPEQYFTNGKKGPWMDIYAIAATMYKILIGKAPQESIERQSTKSTVVSDKLNTSNISYTVKNTIIKAMSIKYTDRYQNISDFRNDLFYGDTNDKTYEQNVHAPTSQQKSEVQKPPYKAEQPKTPEKNSISYKYKIIAVAAVIIVVIILIFSCNSKTKTEKEDDIYNSKANSVLAEKNTQKPAAKPTATATPTATLRPTFPLSIEYTDRYADTTINAGVYNSVAVYSNGHVVNIGSADGVANIAKGDYLDQISSWTDIKEIAAAQHHILGLKIDGSVLCATGSAYKDGRERVSDWADIVEICVDDDLSLGVMSNGRVVYAGGSSNKSRTSGLSNWSKIISVAIGDTHTVGLRNDGTVVATGSNSHGQIDVSHWNDIVAIAADGYYTLGLKSNGRVVSAGSNKYSQIDVGSWSDIVAIEAGFRHCVGLKKDGSVVAAGSNEHGQTNVSSWRNIVSVSAGYRHTIAISSDGKMYSCGSNNEGQTNVSGLSDIKINIIE